MSCKNSILSKEGNSGTLLSGNLIQPVDLLSSDFQSLPVPSPGKRCATHKINPKMQGFLPALVLSFILIWLMIPARLNGQVNIFSTISLYSPGYFTINSYGLTHRYVVFKATQSYPSFLWAKFNIEAYSLDDATAKAGTIQVALYNANVYGVLGTKVADLTGTAESQSGNSAVISYVPSTTVALTLNARYAIMITSTNADGVRFKYKEVSDYPGGGAVGLYQFTFRKQADDTWAEEVNAKAFQFLVSACPSTDEPTTQATGLTFNPVAYNGFTVSWTSGNGSNRVVFVKQANTGTATPADNTTYTANSAFQSGTQIGSTGWYCVYNGNLSSVAVTGLSEDTDYIVQVFEYNKCQPGSENYKTSTGTDNPKVQKTASLDPTISSFSPTSAKVGDTVTITGTNFTYASPAISTSAVKFGEVAAAGFVVVNATTIKAAVAANSASGNVSVTTTRGTVTKSGFVFLPPPAITAVEPDSALAGITVSITGSNFTAPTAVTHVKFGGIEASSFNVVNATTLTAVPAPGSGDGVSLTTPGGAAGYADFLFLSAPKVSSTGTATWKQIYPHGSATIRWWQDVAISSDGMTGLAVINSGTNGLAYRTTDGGQTWTEVMPAGSSTAKAWNVAAISGNGSRMVAGVSSGRLYKSDNTGVSWQEINPYGGTATNKTWIGADISGNGMKIVVCDQYGRLQLSTDGGSAWTPFTLPGIGTGNANWVSCAISGDGNTIIAATTGTTSNTGRVYVSVNGGSTWTDAKPAGDVDREWKSVRVSGDGKTMLAAISSNTNGRVYYSNDYGASWAETRPNGDASFQWVSTSISEDGSKMAAHYWNGKLYFSDDGINWTAGSSPLPASGSWKSLDINEDGKYILAGTSSDLFMANPSVVDSLQEMSVKLHGSITNVYHRNATVRGFIYYDYSDTDKILSDPGVSENSAPGTYGTGSFSRNLSGLTPGNRYNYRAYATNGYGPGYGERRSFLTLAAVPDKPIVVNPKATSLDVAIDPGANHSTVEYAIQDSASAKYIQADSTLGNTVVWKTAAAWDTVRVKNLLTGTMYYFRAKARNADTVATAFGLSKPQNTCANPINGGSIGTAQEICTGSVPQSLTNLGEATEYGGTLEYQWQLSTLSDSTGFSDITGADSTAFAPDTLTTTTWYRRLAKVTCKLTWADATPSNVVEITVFPLTVGGSVSGDTIVCYGSHETLLTLSGHTGDVQKWQWSVDGAAWTDIDSTGSTMIVRDLVEDTWFRAEVQSGVCAPEISGSMLIRVFKNYKIAGYLRYDNNPKTALTGLEVFLRKGSVIIDSALTNWQGKYEFDSLTNGIYGLIVRSAHPTGNWQTWGGVNNTDYLLAYRHAMNTLLLPATPPVIRIAGDVKQPQSPPVVNLADANTIQLAAKYGWGNPSYFQIPKWVFSGLTDTQRIDTFELACISLTRDIRGLCAGDVNGSFTPGTGFKMAAPGLALENRGGIAVTQEMTFPVAVSQTATMGALTLMLNYDPTQIEISGVDMPENAGTPPWFVAENGVLSIGWASLEPLVVNAGQPLLMIRTRVAGATDLIRFTLNDNPLSELADAEGNVIPNVKLTIPDASSSPNAYCLLPVALYPNPAREFLNVEFSMEPDGVACVDLMTLQGVKLLTSGNIHAETGMHKMTLNISDLPNGIYLTKVTRNGQVQIQKLVVNR